MQYNAVDFGKKKVKKVRVMAKSEAGSTFQIMLGTPEGAQLSEVKIPGGAEWTTVQAKVKKGKPGVHNLAVVLKEDQSAEIDWLSFK